MTPAERLLWSRIRKKQVLDLPFYRQKPIDQYIVDFYCPRARLVIEVDGRQHEDRDHFEADSIRDSVLEQLELVVLRFSNTEVFEETEWVVEHIRSIARKRLP